MVFALGNMGGDRGVADGFICPITCLVMRDPVMLTGDGHTYERYAIQQWLNKGKSTSPLTGSAIGDNCQLVPNHAVRKAISELKVDLPSENDIEGETPSPSWLPWACSQQLPLELTSRELPPSPSSSRLRLSSQKRAGSEATRAERRASKSPPRAKETIARMASSSSLRYGSRSTV